MGFFPQMDYCYYYLLTINEYILNNTKLHYPMASLSNNNNNNLLLLQRVDMMLSSEVLLLLRSSAFGPTHMQKIAEFTYGPVEKDLTIAYLKRAADAWFGSNMRINEIIRDKIPTDVTHAFDITNIEPKKWNTAYDFALISRRPSTIHLYSPNLGCIFFTLRPQEDPATMHYYYFSNVKEFMYQLCSMYLHHNEYSRSALHEWTGDISTLDEPPTCKPPTAPAAAATQQTGKIQ